MKKTRILSSISRGEALVEDGALVKALKEGWIAGAGLDPTASDEPLPPSHPLLGLPKPGHSLATPLDTRHNARPV